MHKGKFKRSNYEHPVNGVILGFLLIVMGTNVYRFTELPHPPFGHDAANVLMYFMLLMGIAAGTVSLFDWQKIRQNRDSA